MQAVTKRQKELLDYLRRHIRDRGYAPTLEEIGRHFGLTSVATVHKHLRNLQGKGLVTRDAGRSRALELAPSPDTARAVTIPLLGRVAAGVPIEPVETPESVAIPEDLLGRGETFALRVHGDSMVDDGILDGDLIVVESRRQAREGATVVALVRGEATVKRLYRQRDQIRLQPANERLKPIIVPEDEVEIRGVVIAVIRRYR
jgi:repressor LexA